VVVVDDFVFFVRYILAAEVAYDADIDEIPVAADEVGTGVRLEHEQAQAVKYRNFVFVFSNFRKLDKLVNCWL
jgi:hypothetical protein